MSASRPGRLAFMLPLTLTAAFMACDPGPTEMDPAEVDEPRLARAPASADADIARWLARVRSATAPHHRFEHARNAGWDTDLTGCMEHPTAGGMGHHYADLDLLDDDVEETRPEALLYAPTRNGGLRLVAVEYLVPFSDTWPDDGPAPILHGVEFSANLGAGVWALHAWIWHHNPDGMFADWNKRVNCAHAD